MRHQVSLTIPLAVWTLCAQGGAQSQPRSAAPSEGVVAAFQSKEAGRYAEARDRFLALPSLQSTDAREAALATVWAVLGHNVGKRVLDLMPLQTQLANAERSALASSNPCYRDQLRLLLLDLAQARGELSTANDLVHQLGFVDEWRLLGPFDNERGAGFARKLAPEQGIDLQATYDGKKRQIAWRMQPIVPAPAGRIDLGAIYRPSQQIAVYAAVVVRSERDTGAALHLGCDGASKVFLNGAQVHARDVRRAFAYDQDAVGLSLVRGANLLLVKLCVQDGPASFAVRLTALDGGALPGVTTSSDAAAFAAASSTRAVAPPATPPFLGARTLLAKSAESDPVDAFLLAYLLALRQPDDPNERRDFALATRAAEAMREWVPARYLFAFTRVKPALHAAEKEENPRRHDYEAILAHAPDHPETLRALAEMDLDGVGAAERAEAGLRRALAKSEDFQSARLTLARALSLQHKDAQAHREILRAAQAPSSVEAHRALAQEAERNLDLRSALRHLTTALSSDARPETFESLAKLAARSGDAERARGLLARGIAISPAHSGLRALEAQLFEGEGKLPEAAAAWRSWLEICPEDDSAWVSLARVSGTMGNREAKVAALRQAIELNPNLKDQRRYLEFLEAEVMPFYKPYELSGDAVVKADPGPPADSGAANDPFHYLANQRIVRAYRNGTTSEYRHFLIRILTEEGRRQWNSWSVPYWRGEQRARLLDVRVIKKDGTTRRPKLKGERVDLGGLDLGDVLEIRSRTDDLSPGFFGDYFGLEHQFAPWDGAPSRNSELVLILDPGREYRVQQKNGVPDPETSSDSEGRSVRRWRIAQLPRREHEEGMPKSSEHEPLVRVTTYRDWNHFSSWWWNLVKNQLEVTPAMREKVAALTAGKADLASKVAAVFGFVTTEINYQAWEFGVHGYKPYSTPAIFERRHGDCKDKALLLCALLGELGVEAWPVLIEADVPRSHDDLELPLVSHFNHCIAYMPAQKGMAARFLDGTATWHPVDTVPEMDLGAKVLVVTGERGEIRDIEYPSADATQDRRELAVTLSENGDAEIRLQRTPLLTRAVVLREQLGNEPEKRKENLERELADELGKVVVLELEAGDPQDLTKPVHLAARLTVKGFAQRDGPGLLVKAALRSSPLSGLLQKDKRERALLLGVPHSEIDVVTYELPSGYEPASLPAATKIDHRLFAYSLSYRFENGKLQIQRHYTMKMPRIEVAEYPEFKDALLQAEQADRQVVVVKKAGGR